MRCCAETLFYNGEAEGTKKRAVLNGPLYFTGTETLCADTESAGFAASYIYLNALYIDEPPAPCVAVGMAYGVSCYRPAAAAVTDF